MKKLTREELIAWALRHGYKEDRWGHFQKTKVTEQDVRVTRIRISKSSIRLEVKLAGIGWTRLRSAYIRDVSIDETDKLCGLSRDGCKPNPRAKE